MTISTKAKNNLIDAFIIVIATFISIYLFTVIADLFIRFLYISFAFSCVFTFIYLMVITDVLPHIIIGLLQGAVTALFIRNRHTTIAMIPTLFLFIFEVTIFSLDNISSNLTGFLYLRAFIISSWLLMIISAFLSARWVLRHKSKKPNKNAKGKKRFSFKLFSIIISSIIMPIVLLYAYQYDKLPELNIKSLDASYSRSTQEDEMRIELSFEIENAGKSKTKNSELYSTFPNVFLDETTVRVSPYEFAVYDIPDLTGTKSRSLEAFGDIKMDDFVKYTDRSGGIWLVVVLRWQGDNFVFRGRTFEKYFLFFLKPAIDNKKMVFQVLGRKQKSFTHWLMKETNTPDILKILGELTSKELIYGDTSRFD